MFKKAHGDVKKSTQKVLDPKKDSVTRLKHLRTVLENTEQDEVKQFFDLYYSHIYQVFYDNFILVETSLKQKAHKAQREELDAVLFVLEKILTLLPDLIHQRWQFHSIGRLMKKLLHPGNSLKLRREGVRLYMLWLQALQENASEECLLIFACLIPGFPSPSSDSGMYTLEGLVTGAFHNGSASDAVVPTEISAVLTPQSGERVTDDQTKFFLDAVLEFMVRKLEWKDAHYQPKGFNFLFQHFKQHYLTHIFPSMSSTTSLYQPNLVIPQPRIHKHGDRTDSVRGGDPYLSARVSVIRWVVAFTHELRKPPQSPTGTSQAAPHEEQQKKHILTQKNLEESSEKAASSQDTPDTRADTGEQSHSNTSTLTEKEPSTSSISSLEEGVHSELSDSDMVKTILFSSRRNVDFVHEMLRQGMLLPFTETSAVRKVIKVYQDWIQQDHPVFMEEPDQFVCSPMLGIASDPSSQPQDSPLQQETSTDGPPQVPGEAEVAGYPLRKSQSKSRLRAASYVGAINTAVSEEEGVENVRAGKNPTLQVFFTNSANIFLLEPSYQDAKLVDDQVDMCKKVLNIYRWTVMNVQMDKKTWEQLLLVLLRITEATLKDQPVGRGKNTLGGRLAAALFQTLIVTWIKACLNVHISHELWDQLLRVLSSLTQWEELITEWAKTIETLTRVLARQVYGLDLNDLPLDKLSEQKAKRRKGKGIPVSKKTRTAERSFSRGWSRYEGNKEKAEQMRHRSATTVGAGASRESNIQQAAARARIGALVGRHRPKLERTRSQSGEPAVMQEDSKYPLVRSSSASDIMEEFARDRLRIDSTELPGEDMGSQDSLGEFIKQRLQGESSTLQSMLNSLRSKFRRSSAASDTVVTELTKSPPAPARRRSFISTWISPSAPALQVSDTQVTCLDSPSDTSRVEAGELSKLRAMLSTLLIDHSPQPLSNSHASSSTHQNVLLSASSDQVQHVSADSERSHQETFRYTPQVGTARTVSQTQTCPDEVPLIQLDIEDDVETTPADYDYDSNDYDEDSHDDSEGDKDSQDEDNDSKSSFQYMYQSLEDNSETEALSSHLEYKFPPVSKGQAVETRTSKKSVLDNHHQQKMLAYGAFPVEIGITVSGEDQKEGCQRQAKESTFVVRERNENVDINCRLLACEEPDTDMSSEKTEQSQLKTVLTEETVPLLWEGVSPAVSDTCSSDQKGTHAGRVWSILGNGQSFSSEASAVSTDTTCSVGDVVIGALGSEDKEVASYCTLGDTASEDSVTLGHSGDSSTGHRTTPESATMSRGSATPSPSSPTSPSSRTPSPTLLLSPSPTPSPTAMLESSPEQIPSQKDSPAAESMKLDGEVLVELDSSEVQSEDSSVVTGGSLQGWFPDAAVIVWRRMLGILGDVNEIQDPEIHSQVFDYLCELWLVLMKLRDNLGITTDNLETPPPPELLPPLNVFAPWLFKAISLPNKYKKGQLFAYKLLCRMTIRRHDTELSREHLALFFHALHHGLLSADQDIVNVLVKNCCPLFFALDLSGSSMLVLDFIHAANTVANSSDMNAPRSEAQALLGSLLCIPNLLHDMPVLQPTSAETATMTCKDVKDHIVIILLKSGKKEPNVQARCTVLSCLGIYLYEELAHNTHHPKMKDAINVLLASLKFNHKTVAQVASDMLLLLAQQVDRLAHLQNDLPKKITESIALTITSLLSSPETSTTEADKKVVVSMLFCLLEWCMALPFSVLLTTSAENKRSLILTVFKVLQTAVQGAGSPRHSVVLTELESICLDNVKDVTGRSEPASPSTPPGTEQGILEEETTSSPFFEYPQEGLDMVSLAARTVLSHLVDHIGHFPLGGGPAVLNSLVHEIDDCPELTFMDDLTLEIFQAPNVQFFVLNNKNIISVVEIPAEDLPGGGATGGLTTGKMQARMIVRDIGGKYAWDCSILWGPPRCRTGSCLAPVQLGSISLHDPSLQPDPVQGGETEQGTQDLVQHRDSGTMPAWDNTPQHLDVLDEMLQYIGHTSPECLQKPGEPLNEPAYPPEEIVTEREDSTIQAVLQQQDIEADYVRQHVNDSSMVASDMTETCSCDPKSPFHHCRFLLNQLGMLAWEKRPHLDLLRKNDKLLRELKNLDSRHCRETHKIAVIYVAEGQEDKHSILSNPGGSQAYEDFVAGLAWEVDLAGHRGFMGGLQRNRSTGDTAPYFATSTMEVIFHVATRMPTTTDDSRTKKLRHLGNDEVHIVWSEHTRDYRHGIIATEFGDVLIVIYPLSNHLYRIQIRRKPQVPFFGPLFDGAIVDYKVLPDLVRATAINASRAKRANIPLYQRFYEERAKYVETIVQQHKDLTTFEEFSASVYAPAMGKGAEASSGGSQRDASQSDVGQGGAESEGGVTLRHQQGSPKLRHRMSMKIRRSSGPKLPHSSSSSTTPPDSPNVRGKKT
ncbi:ral GTPase-activating protein subunit alpha-1-like isoform X2 [Branchiostoma floridae x Branchiostoma belcheri]